VRHSRCCWYFILTSCCSATSSFLFQGNCWLVPAASSADTTTAPASRTEERNVGTVSYTSSVDLISAAARSAGVLDDPVRPSYDTQIVVLSPNSSLVTSSMSAATAGSQPGGSNPDKVGSNIDLLSSMQDRSIASLCEEAGLHLDLTQPLSPVHGERRDCGAHTACCMRQRQKLLLSNSFPRPPDTPLLPQAVVSDNSEDCAVLHQNAFFGATASTLSTDCSVRHVAGSDITPLELVTSDASCLAPAVTMDDDNIFDILGNLLSTTDGDQKDPSPRSPDQALEVLLSSTAAANTTNKDRTAVPFDCATAELNDSSETPDMVVASEAEDRELAAVRSVCANPDSNNVQETFATANFMQSEEHQRPAKESDSSSRPCSSRVQIRDCLANDFEIAEQPSGAGGDDVMAVGANLIPSNAAVSREERGGGCAIDCALSLIGRPLRDAQAQEASLGINEEKQAAGVEGSCEEKNGESRLICPVHHRSGATNESWSQDVQTGLSTAEASRDQDAMSDCPATCYSAPPGCVNRPRTPTGSACLERDESPRRQSQTLAKLVRQKDYSVQRKNPTHAAHSSSPSCICATADSSAHVNHHKDTGLSESSAFSSPRQASCFERFSSPKPHANGVRRSRRNSAKFKSQRKKEHRIRARDTVLVRFDDSPRVIRGSEQNLVEVKESPPSKRVLRLGRPVLRPATAAVASTPDTVRTSPSRSSTVAAGLVQRVNGPRALFAAEALVVPYGSQAAERLTLSGNRGESSSSLRDDQDLTGEPAGQMVVVMSEVAATNQGSEAELVSAICDAENQGFVVMSAACSGANAAARATHAVDQRQTDTPASAAVRLEVTPFSLAQQPNDRNTSLALTDACLITRHAVASEVAVASGRESTARQVHSSSATVVSSGENTKCVKRRKLFHGHHLLVKKKDTPRVIKWTRDADVATTDPRRRRPRQTEAPSRPLARCAWTGARSSATQGCLSESSECCRSSAHAVAAAASAQLPPQRLVLSSETRVVASNVTPKCAVVPIVKNCPGEESRQKKSICLKAKVPVLAALASCVNEINAAAPTTALTGKLHGNEGTRSLLQNNIPTALVTLTSGVRETTAVDVLSSVPIPSTDDAYAFRLNLFLSRAASPASTTRRLDTSQESVASDVDDEIPFGSSPVDYFPCYLTETANPSFEVPKDVCKETSQQAAAAGADALRDTEKMMGSDSRPITNSGAAGGKGRKTFSHVPCGRLLRKNSGSIEDNSSTPPKFRRSNTNRQPEHDPEKQSTTFELQRESDPANVHCTGTAQSASTRSASQNFEANLPSTFNRSDEALRLPPRTLRQPKQLQATNMSCLASCAGNLHETSGKKRTIFASAVTNLTCQASRPLSCPQPSAGGEMSGPTPKSLMPGNSSRSSFAPQPRTKGLAGLCNSSLRVPRSAHWPY